MDHKLLVPLTASAFSMGVALKILTYSMAKGYMVDYGDFAAVAATSIFALAVCIRRLVPR